MQHALHTLGKHALSTLPVQLTVKDPAQLHDAQLTPFEQAH
jgi:hypothetical protein